VTRKRPGAANDPRVSTPERSPGVAYLRLVLLAAAIGIPAAYVAALFLAAVHELEDLLWPDDPAWYLVIGLPLIGAVIVLLARRLLPGDGGEPPLHGLSEGATAVRYVPGIALAALGTLAFGAVLGPEAPVIALGSAVGVAFATLARLGERELPVIAMAGSFSAISALFGGPLVAAMLLMEGGLRMGAALTRMLLPGLVAAAVGYLIFVGLGNWGGLDAPGIVVPNLPTYDRDRVVDLAVAVVVGVATAGLITVVRKAALGVTKAPLPMGQLLLGGGLAVGVIAVIADALGASSQDVLFSGQASVPAVVSAGTTKIVVILIVAKAIAYAISLGCGFRGGPIFPAVFLGVGLASLGVVWFDMSPTVAIAMGAAAGMAAQTQLLVAPVLFGQLLVGKPGLDAVSATVLAAAAAWITMSALTRPAPDDR
jgi:H+/Cl- antiporter ClcA